MVLQDAKGEDRVLAVLQKEKRIESWRLAELSTLQVNTSNKYVKFLRDEGYDILTEYKEGVSHCWYVYVGDSKKQTMTNWKQLMTPCNCGQCMR